MQKQDFSNPIPLKNVTVRDAFWSHMQALGRDNVLP